MRSFISFTITRLKKNLFKNTLTAKSDVHCVLAMTADNRSQRDMGVN